ncbi:MAG TPA: patatin-like phospholipase family protein [Candidatus Humimicrobiaceae bacterium]
MFKKPKIGIALSGGGARGLAHIGVLEVLDSLGVQIDAVSGTSMGAIIGAAYCIHGGFKEAKKLLDSTDWKSFLVFSAFQLSRTGLVNEKKVDELLKIFLGDKTFEDCKKQFCCVAVDILSSTKIVLDSGSLREAVLASVAVPGIFSPVCRDNLLLVDGSIMEPLPTVAIQAFNPTFLIASSIVFDKMNPESSGKENEFDPKMPENKKMSIQTIIDKSMNIMQSQMVINYLPYAHIVIEPRIGDFGFLNFGKSQEIIEAGRVAAIEKIPEIKKKLKIR